MISPSLQLRSLGEGPRDRQLDCDHGEPGPGLISASLYWKHQSMLTALKMLINIFANEMEGRAFTILLILTQPLFTFIASSSSLSLRPLIKHNCYNA